MRLISPVIVGLFVAIGISLKIPVWMVIAFVVMETVLRRVTGLRLLK